MGFKPVKSKERNGFIFEFKKIKISYHGSNLKIFLFKSNIDFVELVSNHFLFFTNKYWFKLKS